MAIWNGYWMVCWSYYKCSWLVHQLIQLDQTTKSVGRCRSSNISVAASRLSQQVRRGALRDLEITHGSHPQIAPKYTRIYTLKHWISLTKISHVPLCRICCVHCSIWIPWSLNSNRAKLSMPPHLPLVTLLPSFVPLPLHSMTPCPPRWVWHILLKDMPTV